MELSYLEILEINQQSYIGTLLFLFYYQSYIGTLCFSLYYQSYIGTLWFGVILELSNSPNKEISELYWNSILIYYQSYIGTLP